jgi:GT2 family glycosyltransferase
MITTDIIIISYKDEEPLKECIASIKEHCTDYNLIVEDNNIDNRGFSKAGNIAIKKGTAPFIWLLNSDAIVLKGAQQALIDRFSYGDKVGIVGSMQVDPDDPDIIKCGGMLRAWPSGVHAGGRVSMGHCQIPSKQTWYNFASVMLSRKMVEDIGAMDESMFLLYIDSDYGYYCRSKGYEIWYEPRSVVKHKLHASKTPTEWHRKDMEAFMKKWGITVTPEGLFSYSDLFLKLDLFP